MEIFNFLIKFFFNLTSCFNFSSSCSFLNLSFNNLSNDASLSLFLNIGLLSYGLLIPILDDSELEYTLDLVIDFLLIPNGASFRFKLSSNFSFIELLYFYYF